MGAQKVAVHVRDASKPARGRQLSWRRFLSMYGWLGVPMLVAFVLSALWSAMLAVIQIAPTTVANFLMGTGDLDFGEFWLLTRPDTRIVVPAAATLFICALGYGYLALVMLFPGKFARQGTTRTSSRVAVVNASDAPVTRTRWRALRDWLSRLGRWIYNNKDSAMLSLPKLVFQTTTLVTYLREGFPLVLIFSYSCLLLVNWMFSAFRSAYSGRYSDPSLVTTRLFNSFDLFFAVFAPLHVLVYACINFTFDRDVFATHIEIFSPEDFDRTARLFADPTEISLFTIAFEHLLLSSTTRIFIKWALNGFAIFRWYFVILYLARHDGTPPSSFNRHESGHEPREGTFTPSERLRLFIRRMLPGLVICGVGVGVFVYSIVAVVSSKQLCDPYEQCKVPSFRWNLGETHCSCIVFVDRETALTTLAEWEDPPRVTDELAFLAYSGHLKIVQIINRQVPFFPIELRNCRGLEHLILMYTKTLAIPNWAKDFSNLEYFHVEGDVTAKQLTSIPRDLFENMSQLKFLHLGCLLSLPYVPDLRYLTSLEYLALAMLHTVPEIPSLDGLNRLKKFSIVDDARLPRLPHLHTLHSLTTLAVSYRTPVCCNGFIFGRCNLTAFACLDRSASGEPPVLCATDRILPEDYKILMSTEGVVCPPDLPFDLKEIKPTLETTDRDCGGVMYKQCWTNGVQGICYPARMQPVSCQINPNYTKLRRLQIERRVGDICNPDVEGWLGCSPR